MTRSWPGWPSSWLGAGSDVDDAVVATRLSGLSLLSRGRLDATDVPAFEEEVARPGALKEALETSETACDITVLDTPSGLGRLTLAALAVGDFVLLAFQTESLALRSVGQALQVVEHVQRTANPGLQLLGILPTLVERERPGTHAVLSEMWNGFPDTLETVVPRTEAFARASALGVPVGFLADGAGAPGCATLRAPGRRDGSAHEPTPWNREDP